MPLYEYRCDRCGEVFEVLQKYSDKPLSVHDKCGGTVQKLLSASALQFKGSGFYVNDYAKPGSGAPREGKSGSEGGTDKGAEKSKSDSSSKPSDTSIGNKSESSGSGKSDSHPSTAPTSTPSSDTK